MRHPPADQVITWLYTEDLEGTCRFYSDTIGLEQAYDQGDARVFRVGANAFLGICQAWSNRRVEPSGVIFSFVTDRVDEWYRHLCARGVRTRGEPQLWEKENIYTLFAEDPNGYVLEFQQFHDPAWPRRRD